MMRVSSTRGISVIVSTIVFLLLIMVSFFTGMGSKEDTLNVNFLSHEAVHNALRAPHRKLLLRSKTEHKPAESDTAMEEPTRMWGEKCSRSDILINQGPTSPLPTGIPTYTVEIMNVCVSGCDISGIHMSCGWFSSAHVVNPKVFKRLRYNDCLVNDGKPLLNGGTISFQYANTFSYPLSVSAVICS